MDIQELLEWKIDKDPKLPRTSMELTADNLAHILESHVIEFDMYLDDLPDVRELANSLKRAITIRRAELARAYKNPNSPESELAAEEIPGKLSEKAIDSLIETDKDLCALEAKLVRARRAIDARERLRDVFLARESTCRGLIQLHAAGVYIMGSGAGNREARRVENLQSGARGTPDGRSRERDTRQGDRQDPVKRFKRQART